MNEDSLEKSKMNVELYINESFCFISLISSISFWSTLIDLNIKSVNIFSKRVKIYYYLLILLIFNRVILL